VGCISTAQASRHRDGEGLDPHPEPTVVGKYRYAASYWLQHRLVQLRAFNSWWRNLAFNEVRLMSSSVLGLCYCLIYVNINANSWKLAGIFRLDIAGYMRVLTLVC
jgi:hypothetical protein